MTVVVAAVAMAAAVWLLMPAGGRRLRTSTSSASVDAIDVVRQWVRRRRLQAVARQQGIDALAALAAELRSGQLPADALVNATTSPPVWPHAVAAAVQHGDVAAGLDADATTQSSLRALAACWRLAEHSGSGLADAVDRLVASARADERVRGELQAQLAAPRASARMLALLPLFGIALGLAMGADPLHWLLGSPLGLLSLAIGAALIALGLWWTGRIAAKVEAQL